MVTLRRIIFCPLNIWRRAKRRRRKKLWRRGAEYRIKFASSLGSRRGVPVEADFGRWRREKEATAGARGCSTSSERRLTNRFRGASSVSAFSEKIQADPLSLGDKSPARYGYVLEVLPAGPRLLE